MLGDIWFIWLQHRWRSRSSRMHYHLFCVPLEYGEALHRDISHLPGGHHINMKTHIDDCSRESSGCCEYQVILWQELFEHSSSLEAWLNDDFPQNRSMWQDPDILQRHHFQAEDRFCDDRRTSSHNMCGGPQSLNEIGAHHLKMIPTEIRPESFSSSLRISIRQPKYSWDTLMPRGVSRSAEPPRPPICHTKLSAAAAGRSQTFELSQPPPPKSWEKICIDHRFTFCRKVWDASLVYSSLVKTVVDLCCAVILNRIDRKVFWYTIRKSLEKSGYVDFTPKSSDNQRVSP